MADLGFEETELRLGLPGGGCKLDAGDAARSSSKRGFAETVDLKLKLQPASAAEDEEVEQVAEDEVSSAAAEPLQLPPAADGKMKRSPSQSSVITAQPDPEKPRAPKAQVVGWPPVRSFRKNVLAVQAEKSKGVDGDGDKPGGRAAAKLVKVSMDGAPYLRKVDLAMYESYQELSMALQKLFSSFTIGKCGAQQGMNSLNESKRRDLLDVPTYEDKDGDWMLVGDVPWEMFVESCKRIRIMKDSEAIVGLAPRAMEKCKSRS
ncbi:hypothetical protein GUJ93_ZPchr0003g16825 [Zizania palustris]|uniref:Auxin-responsive protein n=1 Tax=Zizania palustris TaxID=103762 RepID=A0A8J5VXM3_ZIZPA|nr:hypothetical protein GUJ93_ZPchr0003g16825 [Zizania palustris]